MVILPLSCQMIILHYAKQRIFIGRERTLENVRSGLKKYDIPIPERTFSKVRSNLVKQKFFDILKL